MSDSANRRSLYPYPDFAQIKIKNGEPMSSAYFNAHVVRLCSNIEALDNDYTLQKASWTQWGLVKFASEDDILSKDGNRETVVTNDCINRAMRRLGSDTRKEYNLTGRLNFSSTHEFQHGEFLVGLNENIARKVTDSPERVEFSQVYFVPVGFEGTTFYTAKSTKTDEESAKTRDTSSGVINFAEWKRPEGYDEFHCYYHRSGYVICRNGKYNDSQRQIRVVYNLFMLK